MKCEHCEMKFTESMDGLAQMTFHLILEHPSEVNEQVS